jgi:hypothetical protein
VPGLGQACGGMLAPVGHCSDGPPRAMAPPWPVRVMGIGTHSREA